MAPGIAARFWVVNSLATFTLDWAASLLNADPSSIPLGRQCLTNTHLDVALMRDLASQFVIVGWSIRPGKEIL